MNMYTSVCMFVSVYTHMYFFTHFNLYCIAPINNSIRISICGLTSSSILIHKYIYMSIHVCIYMYIYTHIPRNVLCHIRRINVKPVLCCIGVESIYCCTSLRALQEGIQNPHITNDILDMSHIYNIFDMHNNYLIYM